MADAADPDSPAPNGAAAAGAPADDDASLLAELEAEQAAAGGGKPAAKPGKAAKPEPDADDVDDGDADDGAAPSEDDEEPADLDDDDDEPADEDPDAEDDELAAAGKDPELAKRIAAVRRTEQRQREQLRRDREAFERERDQLTAQRQGQTDAQKQLEAFRARAKLDPAGVLAELGLAEDDMEYAAQQAYARSKAAAAKPEYRAAAERALRDRKADERITAAEQKAAALEARLAERDQQAAVRRELDSYFGRAIRKVDDATPRTKALIAKNPKQARAELAATALELVEKTKRSLPEIKARELLAAHEKKIARRLRLYGVEDAAAPAADAESKPNGKKPAAAAAKPNGKPARAAPAADADETAIPSAADLVRELQAQQRN